MVIEGFLVKAPAGRIRLLVERYCLEFHDDDLLDLQPLPPPPNLVPGAAVAARLTFVEGARLFAIAPSAPYDDAIWISRKLFAMATRDVEGAWSVSPLFRAKEDEFYRRKGMQRNPTTEAAVALQKPEGSSE
jgi:hypothetical protein